MKKIKLIIIISLSLLLIVSITIIIIASNNKKIEEGYHTILENKSYVYDENRKMVFNVYSDTENSLIADTSNNSFILDLGNLRFTLENVNVSMFKISGSTLIKIKTDIPEISNVVNSDSAKLIIYTRKNTISLKIGAISILNPKNYTLLGVDRLYGSYCIVDNYKQLVGINIKFNKIYENVESFKVGEYTYGNFRTMTNDNYDNEINIKKIIPDYNIYRVEKTSPITLNNDSYFIPLNYLSLMLIREGYITLKINNKDYYIDNFTFMTNDLSYEEYKDIMKDGEII